MDRETSYLGDSNGDCTDGSFADSVREHETVELDLQQDPPGCGIDELLLDVGGEHPRQVPLESGKRWLLGSGASADILVAHPTVSARHCWVERRADAVLVTDAGSKNGLWVGGARVPSATLPAGATMIVGGVSVSVGWAEPIDAAEDEPPLQGLIGESSSMRRLARAVRNVAVHPIPVLLRGETGAGKDVVARAIHAESPRAKKPFIAINAAAISRELAASELFGHRKGAFTGAVLEHVGAFREAHGGTLFLDEVGSLPLEVQAKLLRVVEDGAVRPVGGEGHCRVDVRLVAATCEPLEQMVEERLFRRDLYERLAIAVLRVPALREHVGDIPALAKHLLRSSELGPRGISPAALACLATHRWPGNVRELRNVLIQSALRARGAIQAEDVRSVLAARAASGHRRKVTPLQAREIFERYGRNASAAARAADLPRSTLRDLLKLAPVA